MRILLVLFVLIPLAELYVLIEVGSQIGGLATVALCIGTALLGGLIVRYQGLMTWMKATQSMMKGEVPAFAALHGIMLVFASFLLLTPGLVTDILGFTLLIPAVRQWVIKRIVSRHGKPVGPGQNVIDADIVPQRHYELRK